MPRARKPPAAPPPARVVAPPVEVTPDAGGALPEPENESDLTMVAALREQVRFVGTIKLEDMTAIFKTVKLWPWSKEPSVDIYSHYGMFATLSIRVGAREYKINYTSD